MDYGMKYLTLRSLRSHGLLSLSASLSRCVRFDKSLAVCCCSAHRTFSFLVEISSTCLFRIFAGRPTMTVMAPSAPTSSRLEIAPRPICALLVFDLIRCAICLFKVFRCTSSTYLIEKRILSSDVCVDIAALFQILMYSFVPIANSCAECA